MHRAPTARVTRFFLWRKWTLIVILIQMYIQAAIDVNNFMTFLKDPYEKLCPVRAEVRAREKEAAAQTAAQAAALAKHPSVIQDKLADTMSATKNVTSRLESHIPPSLLAWAEKRKAWFESRNRHGAVETMADGEQGHRALQEQEEGAEHEHEHVEVMAAAHNGTRRCDVCIGPVKASSCYRYFATPGLTELIKRREGNEARTGTLGFRMLNSTEPVTLFMVCNGQPLGNLTSSCFYDGKLLVRRNCSIWLHSDSYKMLDMYTSFSHIRYAPDASMSWGDCDAVSHKQGREAVCLLDGRLVGGGFCDAGQLSAPDLSRSCCSSYEDVYDTVYSNDYYNVVRARASRQGQGRGRVLHSAHAYTRATKSSDMY
jgi:hypothetical protein